MVELFEQVKGLNLVEVSRIYTDALLRYAQTQNELMRLRATKLDSEARTAIEKQELRLLASDSRYRELKEEAELLKALIKSCEFALEALKTESDSRWLETADKVKEVLR